MASADSRIPKGFGFKRPNENALPQTEKKRRLEIATPISKSKSFLKPLLTPSVNDVGRFSEINKRAVLKPQKNIESTRATISSSSLPSQSVSTGQTKKKIPAWDLKGRLAEAEKKNTGLQYEIKRCKEQVAALEREKLRLSENASSQVVELEQKLKQQSEESSSALKKLENALKKTSDDLEKEVKAKNDLQERCDLLFQEIQQLKQTSETYQLKICTMTNLLSDRDSEIKGLKNKANELMDRLCAEERTRRKMHNIIQELKGNIRVFCRVRPALPEEIKNNLPMSVIQVKADSKTLEINRSCENNSTEGLKKRRGGHEFTFDYVFHPSSTQDDVFQEISHLVQSALDGYNVCIFAYGQTGSGKTYTMEGPADILLAFENNPQIGMIPRSVHQIFNSATELEAKGWKYTMETSFMEIYNEHIRDLLVEKGQNEVTKCEIKRSACNGMDSYVSNVKTVHVTSEKEVYSLLRKARLHRAVAATNCNDHSSRSHYVFQMKLSGENSLTGEKCEGILNLVDLAGSERVKESGSEGERLREAKNINKSLSSLGNVILALLQKADHIPYRNSKLTHLLMNSLGGNSKTLMFVNINPCEDNFGETVNSLRFAAKVNQCVIGAAEKRK